MDEENKVAYENEEKTNIESQTIAAKIVKYDVVSIIMIIILVGIIYGWFAAIAATIFIVTESEYIKEKYPENKILSIVCFISCIIAGAIIFTTYELSIYISVVKGIWLVILIISILNLVLNSWFENKFPNNRYIQIALSVIVSIVLVIIISNEFISVENINKIKKGNLTAYSSDITIGDAFENYFEDISWDYYVSENNDEIVKFTGKCYIYDELTTVTLKFLTKEDTFEICDIAFDGESQNKIYIYGLLSDIYESY